MKNLTKSIVVTSQCIVKRMKLRDHAQSHCGRFSRSAKYGWKTISPRKRVDTPPLNSALCDKRTIPTGRFNSSADWFVAINYYFKVVKSRVVQLEPFDWLKIIASLLQPKISFESPLWVSITTAGNVLKRLKQMQTFNLNIGLTTYRLFLWSCYDDNIPS